MSVTVPNKRNSTTSTNSTAQPRFRIRPPLTTGDKGIPSHSLSKDMDRVLCFIEDERHLIAHELYTSVQSRMKVFEEKQKAMQHHSKRKKGKDRAATLTEQEDYTKAKQNLLANKDVIHILENRCRIFRRAQQNLNIDEDWTFASLHFGITTYYRRETDGSLSIKLEGEITGVPLFEQIAVLRDVDHHYKWVPFCTSSMKIAELDKLDLIGWFMTGVPQIGLARDGCFRVIGCDNMSEDGSILIAGQGIQDLKPGAPPPDDSYLCDDPIIEKLNIQIPPVPTKRGNGRMTIRKFETVVHVISPTSATTRVVTNIDPNIPFLSQRIIDFLLKHLAGVMLHKLQGAAKKAMKNPVHNHHAQRMREESEFYELWLMAKFRCLCDERGWEMPTVKAFALNEEYLSHNRYNQPSAIGRINTFDGVDDKESDGVSFKSTPNFSSHLNVDDDAVSEITTRSNNAIWNPLGSYLRQMEERDQQKKAAEIAHIRDRVANLIKPKQLSFEQQERLKELKDAKARRMFELGKVEDSDDVSVMTFRQEEETLSAMHKLSSRRHSHGRVTRFSVTSALVVLLFSMLNPKLLLRDTIEKLDASDVWWIDYFEDVGTVVYLLLCSACHFLLCDTALVYAFGALDLGSKTGRQVKRYYSRNVRLCVALFSFGIVGVSLAKALVKVSARQAIIYWSHLFRFRVHSDDSFLGSIGGFFSNCWLLVTALAEAVFHSGGYLISYLSEKFLIGRVVFDILQKLVELPVHYVGAVGSFIHASMDFEASIEHNEWRSDAFLTAKSLFSYSSVFLFCTLFLFNLIARKSLKVKSRTQSKTIPRPANAPPAVARVHTPDSGAPNATAVTSPSSSNSRKKHSLLRFRRNKTKSSLDQVKSSPKASQRVHLHAASSY